ncbi:hypothetical protein CHLRE_09g417100v5 [Chlamydomonas reinhardtii]|uniref:Uncharacterized protein n=1 Tax=Chlamydomonas reinhardtii TaxID=3055 RepID=A8J535_CHLRE|nr:uncharacterized protein CHLRE_09g417100v5 [Chlamydomonas reinhardtii]PNW79490.1 hypothetical protein CHLRE_09g417100v5 [Chlamydomonas reinhardtii]7PKT_L Chain L, mL87 [Chlamydomonas reinhardtii]|eukprot:XP_001696762.1 predicted protein [Chlamydomonas reinhardtii]
MLALLAVRARSPSLPSITLPARLLSTQTSASVSETYSNRPTSSAESTEAVSSSGQSASKWDWKWVLGKASGRKPAITRPRRHQWHYCNPEYDPAAPLPEVLRSPFGPPGAERSHDWATYARHLQLQPENRRDLKRYRARFVRFMQLRELDWREAFQRGVAEDSRVSNKVARAKAEAQRQDAWSDYKQAMWQRAQLADSHQSHGTGR